MQEVKLFTDGGCSKIGKGGWAFILRHPKSGKEVEKVGTEVNTTNNRMELMGVIEGLKSLTAPCKVELVADSQYVGFGLSDWLPKWKAQGWKRKEGRTFVPIKNLDLWQELDKLAKKHQITFVHVRGHQGHPENERCDQLAVEAYRNM